MENTHLKTVQIIRDLLKNTVVTKIFKSCAQYKNYYYYDYIVIIGIQCVKTIKEELLKIRSKIINTFFFSLLIKISVHGKIIFMHTTVQK